MTVHHIRIPGTKMARLSSCAKSVVPPDQLTADRDYQINRCMKELYREGYRRFRVVPKRPTGDYVVFGWPK